MDEVIAKIIQGYPVGKRDLLIPLLQEIQAVAGHLSNDSLQEVSRHMKIPLNKIYGVATFYDQFRFKNKGTFHFRVCRGTACHVYRSSTFLLELEKLLHVKAGQTSKDGKYSLEIVNCLGACNSAPVMAINETYYTGITPANLPKIIVSLKEKAD